MKKVATSLRTNELLFTKMKGHLLEIIITSYHAEYSYACLKEINNYKRIVTTTIFNCKIPLDLKLLHYRKHIPKRESQTL